MKNLAACLRYWGHGTPSDRYSHEWKHLLPDRIGAEHAFELKLEVCMINKAYGNCVSLSIFSERCSL